MHSLLRGMIMSDESRASTGKGLWIIGVAAAFVAGALGGLWAGYLWSYRDATARYDERVHDDQVQQAMWNAEYVTKLKKEVEELRTNTPR